MVMATCAKTPHPFKTRRESPASLTRPAGLKTLTQTQSELTSQRLARGRPPAAGAGLAEEVLLRVLVEDILLCQSL